MHVGRRFTLFQALKWEKKYLFILILLDSIPVLIYHFFSAEWIHIPWQPISLIGVAVAFYLGFKNNSSYERLWEARKIWGGIINESRAFCFMTRDLITNNRKLTEEELGKTHKTLIYRQIAWAKCLSLELRKPQTWEHKTAKDDAFKKKYDIEYSLDKFEYLKKYLSEEEYNKVMNSHHKSLHILNIQSIHLRKLFKDEAIDNLQHITLQKSLNVMIELQGKCERIKNFPFPRQYATVNYLFVMLFMTLLPFGMLDVFTQLGSTYWIWYSIPFSVLGSWVFWTTEMVGDYSENPFEGTYNDVPIKALSRVIERDLLTIIGDDEIPEPITPINDYHILV